MGVKDLWQLLASTGRLISRDDLTNQVLAIDVSIWVIKLMYGSLKYKGPLEINTMYLNGIMRRILKLLYYGVKPVFVFDGKFPELKRRTIIKRYKLRAERKINMHKFA